MRTIFLKASQHLPLHEAIHTSKLVNRYGQLLIYVAVLGIIAYLYILANGLFMQYLTDLSAGTIPEYE